MNNKVSGVIIIPPGAKPWPHELKIALILTRSGHKVEFIPESTVKTADILLDNMEFELKSPISGKLDAVGRNLNRGAKQSPNIIFDSSRMKNIRDGQVAKILISYLKKRHKIKKIIFINKKNQIIDISELL